MPRVAPAEWTAGCSVGVPEIKYRANHQIGTHLDAAVTRPPSDPTLLRLVQDHFVPSRSKVASESQTRRSLLRWSLGVALAPARAALGCRA